MNAEYTANATNGTLDNFKIPSILRLREYPKRKFHALYEKVFRKDILQEAGTQLSPGFSRGRGAGNDPYHPNYFSLLFMQDTG